MNFKEIIQFAVENDFQELFFTVGSKPSLRIHKEIIEIENLPILNLVMLENLLTEIISQNQLNSIKEKEHVNFHYNISDLCNLNIFISYTNHHCFIKIKNLNPSKLTLEELNLPSQIIKAIQDNSGLYIFSGENFDGKTSTLNALIQKINQEEKKLICILQDEEQIKIQNQKSIILNTEIEEIEDISPDVLVIDNLSNEKQLHEIDKLLENGKKILLSINANSSVQTIQNIAAINEELAKKILSQHLKLICNMELLKSKADSNLYPVSEVFIANSENFKILENLDYSQIQNLIETGKNQGMHTKKQDINALQNLGLA
ncbi:hypothetical protein CL656_03555 [bacterium]|nr:hypothetical protein [bacterium]